MSPRNFQKMKNPNFIGKSMHSEARDKEREMEEVIEKFFKAIIRFLTFSRFFKN